MEFGDAIAEKLLHKNVRRVLAQGWRVRATKRA